MARQDPDAPRRPPGRPCNVEPGRKVMTWLTAREHDQLIRIAARHDVSVSAVVRRVLETRLRAEDHRDG